MPRFFKVCKGYISEEGITQIKLPERCTQNAAGYDFYCPATTIIPSYWGMLFKKLFGFNKAPIRPTVIWTHVKAKMNKNEYLALYNRSSNPIKKGLIMSNGVGIVDSDYWENETNDGDIGFQFYNFFPMRITIEKGDRIGQGIFHTFLKVQEDIDEDKPSRTGGHGSTDNVSKP